MSTIPSLNREMTADAEVSPSARFPMARLPWIVGGVALLVYLVSLNHWMSFASTAQISKAAGWAYYPELQAPLNWLLTLPFRGLPASLIPIALNLFSALLATLCLMLLARSVALLPHDRTMIERERQRDHTAVLSIPWAWIPPVFAAIVCGLQLSFWESATNATTVGMFAIANSMLDLLLFAYVIRCLLEYRIDERPSWLIRSSFVYGLAMTNDWAMIGFFPLFLIAMAWIAGARLFRADLLLRLFLAGIAGLMLYFFLPIVTAFSDFQAPFWASLRYNLGNQRYMLLMYLGQKQSLLPLFLISFVPIVWMGIRWPNSLGDTSARGTAFAKALFHIVHAFFLLACIWISLDPQASPRNQTLGVRFLTFYYLGALSVGYFLGYFLLVFGPHQPPRIARRLAQQGSFPNPIITGAVLCLIVLVPALLVARNWPQIRQTNGPMLRQYAELLAEKLPQGPALVISDDLQRAMLIEAVRATTGKGKDWVVVVSSALKEPVYHRYIKKRYGNLWPYKTPENTGLVTDLNLLNLVDTVRQTVPVYYLHPSFGYFFETFYLEPHGLVYQLLPYPGKELRPAPFPESLIDENKEFWDRVHKQFLPDVAHAVERRAEPPLAFIAKPLHLRYVPNRDLALLGSYYSRCLNYWGVELQKLRRLDESHTCFERALEANPDNGVAQINIENNRALAESGRVSVHENARAEDAFRSFMGYDQIVIQHGPFDDPYFCNAQGEKLHAGNNYRQAGQYFLRATELDPLYLTPYMQLGLVYVLGAEQKRALEILQSLRARPEMQEAMRRQKADVMYLEASCHLAITNDATALNVIQTALTSAPGNSNVVWAATRVLMDYRRYANALEVVNDQLPKLEIQNPFLLNKAWIALQIQDYKQAKEAADELIAIDKNPDFLQRAYLNRAIANLQLNQEDAAAADYAYLQKTYPGFVPTSVYFGLGEIAYRKRDTNAAIHNYDLYLTAIDKEGVPEEELKQVNNRLKELKIGSR